MKAGFLVWCVDCRGNKEWGVWAEGGVGLVLGSGVYRTGGFFFGGGVGVAGAVCGFWT